MIDIPISENMDANHCQTMFGKVCKDTLEMILKRIVLDYGRQNEAPPFNKAFRNCFVTIASSE